MSKVTHIGIQMDNSQGDISDNDIAVFQGLVLSWAQRERRHFPWRRVRENKYRLVITELLLQRTKAETVRKYYETFFSRFPNWESIAQAPEAVIGETLKPLGLWKRRAPVLKRLSSVMTARNGRFPSKREDIDSLPGVGQYMGNAIELLCQHQPRPLLDAGMARVLERYFGPRKLADIRYDPYLQALSHRVVKHDSPREINWAILDFGALVCKIKKPGCKTCKLRAKCWFGQKTIGSQNSYFPEEAVEG